MMRLSSQVKFCFQECQFHPEVTCTILNLNETQKSSLPRILVVSMWLLQKVLARSTLIFHTPALSGFSWTRKVRDLFLCLFQPGCSGEAKFVPLGSSPKANLGHSGTVTGALLVPSLDSTGAFWLSLHTCSILTLHTCSITFQGVMPVLTRISNSSLMNPLVQLYQMWLGNQIVPVGLGGLWCPKCQHTPKAVTHRYGAFLPQAYLAWFH